MSVDVPSRLELGSLDVAEDRVAMLRETFPEVFHEGKIDFDALKRSLGEWVEPGRERFGLTWPGKANAMRAVQQRSHATLAPDRVESVDFDATQNVIIEGENLEVLKLLQKSYYGQVKMIYIDPPYNTGSDFIYPDDYSQPLQEYLRWSGQVDGNGARQTTNTETSGRYHSNWLNMMYPRLYLARNLLRDDGVIFVSIDDHEVHNLRALMNEILGEENFCGIFVWEKKKKPSFLNAQLGIVTEYVVTYARNRISAPQFTKGSVEEGKMYPFNNAGNPLSVLTFPPMSVTFGFGDCTIRAQDMSEGNIKTTLLDDVVIRDGTNSNKFRLQGEWRYSQDKVNEFVRAGDEIVVRKEKFRPNYVNNSGKEKKTGNLLSVKGSATPTYEDATGELRAIFGGDVVGYPKPVGLLQYLISTVTREDDVILDFFAGSGTTGHAVMKLNAEDGGNRRFILVQLPEPAEGDYPTISAITRERVRRAGAKLKAEQAGKLNLAKNAGGAGFWVPRLSPDDEQFQAVGSRSRARPDRHAA